MAVLSVAALCTKVNRDYLLFCCPTPPSGMLLVTPANNHFLTDMNMGDCNVHSTMQTNICPNAVMSLIASDLQPHTFLSHYRDHYKDLSHQRECKSMMGLLVGHKRKQVGTHHQLCTLMCVSGCTHALCVCSHMFINTGVH